VEKLLITANEEPAPFVLWSMSYVQHGRASSDTISKSFAQDKSGRVLAFPPASLDLSFDDALVDSVRAVWRKIMDAEADDADFLRLEEREIIGDSDD
jgi:Rab proteins geranylgeranyltransferase component A